MYHLLIERVSTVTIEFLQYRARVRIGLNRAGIERTVERTGLFTSLILSITERAWAHWARLGRPKLIVAPMMEYSELPFRMLSRKYIPEICCANAPRFCVGSCTVAEQRREKKTYGYGAKHLEVKRSVEGCPKRCASDKPNCAF
jgi:hypothetical protein